jgi:hypothetical protein
MAPPWPRQWKYWILVLNENMNTTGGNSVVCCKWEQDQPFGHRVGLSWSAKVRGEMQVGLTIGVEAITTTINEVATSSNSDKSLYQMKGTSVSSVQINIHLIHTFKYSRSYSSTHHLFPELAIQECNNAFLAVNLFRRSFLNRHLMKSFALLLWDWLIAWFGVFWSPYTPQLRPWIGELLDQFV